jgi:glucosamine--fructose-6-phosphate aminotransferase (isomerizing)
VALLLAKSNDRLLATGWNSVREAIYLAELWHLPVAVELVLALEPKIAAWAQHFADKRSALFLGRGRHYPIAMEGALKLKEISYIHAEAYPAGELKHGLLALVGTDMPVVVIAPNDVMLDKLKVNMQEECARGGQLFVFTEGCGNFVASDGVNVLPMPEHTGCCHRYCMWFSGAAGVPRCVGKGDRCGQAA